MKILLFCIIIASCNTLQSQSVDNKNFRNITLKAAEKPRSGLLANHLGVAPVPGLKPIVAVAKPHSVMVDANEPEAVQIQQGNCKCTPTNLCVNPPSDGAGVIDPRIVNNASPTPAPTCSSGEVYCCSQVVPTPICGVSNTIPISGVTPVNGQSNFGDNPWVAIVFAGNTYLGGATVIDSYNVITAAHKVLNRSPTKVRFGEWDINSETVEPYKFIEIAIQEVIIHSGFNNGNLQNDIAVIKLASPIDLTTYPHIKSACLPGQGTSATYNGQRCRVAGFGKDAFAATNYQAIMKEVEVPIINASNCEQRLRQTRLGPGFILNQNSFMCAGGEVGKDACTGDGGSPVVCKSSGGQWTVVGLVAWGVGCANENVPGVYVNVANYRDWIDSNKRK